MTAGVLLCSPKYAGLSVGHQRSARALELWCAANGIRFDIRDVANAPVDAARDLLAAEFMKLSEDGGFDRLLMVDAGIGFEVETVRNLLAAVDAGHDFVAAAAPLRSQDVSRALGLAAGGMDAKLAELNAANFVIDFERRSDDASRVVTKTIAGRPFVKTRRIGAACLMLTRTVFESIRDNFPELEDDTGWFSYFLPAVIAHDGVRERRGEDVAFCLRWRMTGGEIWTSLNEPLSHEGHATFKGNLGATFGLGAPPPQQAAAAQPAPGVPE